MKVIIVGSGEMLMNLIAGCKDFGCKIVGVLRAETQYMSKFRLFIKNKLNPSKDFTYIKSHKLHEIKTKSVNSDIFRKEILKNNVDIVIAGTWGEKFEKEIIDLPKLCTINVHPSLLPKYRGPNPYIEVIRNMETETGVSFHLMNEFYDRGAILLQKKVPILENDTGKELKTRVTNTAREGIRELLEQLENDIVIPIEQNENQATYYKRISEKDLLLDFNKSAKELAAQIRGLHPFAKSYFANNSHFLVPNPYKLEIIENQKGLNAGQVYEADPEYRIISVVCKDGKVLRMKDVKLFGILRVITDLYIKLKIKVGKSLL